MDLVQHRGGAEAFIRDAATYTTGGLTLEQLADLHRLSPEGVLEDLSHPDTMQAVARAAAQMEQSGLAIRGRAREALSLCIDRIRAITESPDVSPSLLVRAAEFLERVAEIVQSAKAETAGPKFSITINLSTPPRSSRTPSVIDVRPEGPRIPSVIDVTPEQPCDPL